MLPVNILIRERRRELGLTMRDVASRIGVSASCVCRWENGDIAQMKRSNIYALARVLQLSPLALLGYDVDASAENVVPLPSMRQVPIIGTIACGAPILAEENVDGLADLPEHVRADFALRCKGDSMINARIFDGDLVYILQASSVRDGEIAAVLIGDEATLKRVRLFPDHIVLEAENPTFRPLVFWGADAENVRIIGRVVAFTSVVR